MAREKLGRTGYDPPSMDHVKRILILMLVGAALGNIAATFVAPKWVTWYNTPQDPTANCNCMRMAVDISQGIIRIQTFGTVIGAILFLIIGIFVSRFIANRAAKTGTTTTPPAPTASV